MSDPSAGSHPAWPALEKGALWDHDPRLQAAWNHYSVCRHEHPRRQRDRRLHAMNTQDGSVIDVCMPTHNRCDWIRFLKLIDRRTPPDKQLHLIKDNYAAHKAPEVQTCLARQ